MNGAYYVGAIGLQAQERALEVISNNIANVNTPAFKRSDIRFASLLASRLDPDVSPTDLAAAMFSPAGVKTSAALTMDEPGVIETTGRPSDLAIEGRGFIELMGPDGQTLLWRGGTIKVGDDGALVAADSGLPLRGAIALPADATGFVIAADGTVRAQQTSGEPTEVGQITLVAPDDMSKLTAIDGGFYRISDESRLEAVPPGEDGMGRLIQGGIERSNVEMTTEMVQLMLVQRAYAANAQILQAADQLAAVANGLRR